jgi:hypothetical protein
LTARWSMRNGNDRLTQDIPNLHPPLDLLASVKIDTYTFIYLPSAPVYSTIALTFCANSFRLLSVDAACEKPEVSPHPPIAIIIFVPFANFGRTCSTVVKSGHSDTSSSLNVEERMKASATWVMSDTRDSSGTTSCCLDAL